MVAAVGRVGLRLLDNEDDGGRIGCVAGDACAEDGLDAELCAGDGAWTLTGAGSWAYEGVEVL